MRDNRRLQRSPAAVGHRQCRHRTGHAAKTVADDDEVEALVRALRAGDVQNGVRRRGVGRSRNGVRVEIPAVENRRRSGGVDREGGGAAVQHGEARRLRADAGRRKHWWRIGEGKQYRTECVVGRAVADLAVAVVAPRPNVAVHVETDGMGRSLNLNPRGVGGVRRHGSSDAHIHLAAGTDDAEAKLTVRVRAPCIEHAAGLETETVESSRLYAGPACVRADARRQKRIGRAARAQLAGAAATPSPQ